MRASTAQHVRGSVSDVRLTSVRDWEAPPPRCLKAKESLARVRERELNLGCGCVFFLLAASPRLPAVFVPSAPGPGGGAGSDDIPPYTAFGLGQFRGTYYDPMW